MDLKRNQRSTKRVLIQEPANDEPDGQAEERERFRPQLSQTTETQEPFMGMKVRRRASMYRQYRGDYINLASNQQIVKLLTKQGDRQVLFADGIVKVNRDGHIKRRILIITDVALTRKTEIVTVLVEATKNVSDNSLDVLFSNRFEYHVDCENSREVLFEEVEGGVKMKMIKK